MNRILSAFTLMIALGSFAVQEHPPVQSTSPFTYKTGVFYFPIGRDTYRDITEDDLLRCEDLTSLEQGAIPDLVTECKKGKAPGQFIEGAARLRLILPGNEEYIVDDRGAVKHVLGKDRKVISVTTLSKDDLEHLHHLIVHRFVESDSR